MGYNVAVDGILGPQTKGATKAFLTKVPATRWNRGSAPKTGGSNPNRFRGPGGGGVDHSKHDHGGGKTELPKLPGLSGPGIDEGLIDPASYAKSLVAMEYDPLIGSMTRDIRGQRAQGQQNLADITSWFNQLEGTRAQGAAANQATGAASIADLQRMQAGMQNALGGDANIAGSEGAAYAGINLAGVQGLNQSQGNFDRNLQTILGMQSNDARTSQMRGQESAMQEMLAKRSDLFKSKGSAYSKALQDAIQLRTQQRGQNIQQASAQQALQMAREMAPYELQNTKLGLDIKQQQLNQQGAGFKQNQRESALDYQIKKAQYEDFIANLGDEGKVGFGDLNSKDRLGLSESIRSMATGSPGNVAAMRTINAALMQAGFNTKNPNVRAFANSILVSLPGYRPNRGKKKKK
jgi:hypothetical protein